MKLSIAACGIVTSLIALAAAAGVGDCTWPYNPSFTPTTLAVDVPIATHTDIRPTGGCYDLHRLAVAPSTVYFDTTIRLQDPGLPVPPHAVAFVPQDSPRFRKPAILDLHFHAFDVPSMFTVGEMRPYALYASPFGGGSQWKQLDGFAPPAAAATGYIVQGPVRSLQETVIFAAQPGLVDITTACAGAAICTTRNPAVTGVVRRYNLSTKTWVPCSVMTLTVNGVPAPLTSAGPTSCSFLAAASFASDGVQTITARVVTPSGDESRDVMTVDIDTEAPVLLSTLPEHLATLDPGRGSLVIRFQDAHCDSLGVPPQVQFRTSPAPTTVCVGDPCCYVADYDLANDATAVFVSIELRDLPGNSAMYSLELYGTSSAKITGYVVNATSLTGVFDMPILIDGVAADPSEPDGRFVISGLPSALSGPHLIKFDAGQAGAPTTEDGCTCSPTERCPYATFALAADVVFQRGEYSVPESVKLPAINAPCLGVPLAVEFDAATNECRTIGLLPQVITVPVLEPGASPIKLTIDTGTKLVHPNGGCDPWVVSVTEVPKNSTPQSLPWDMSPSIIVTVQPSGLEFDPPPRLDFPNLASYVPGTPTAPHYMSLYSVDPLTDLFYERGKMTISATEITSDPGTGVGVAGWHCTHSPKSSPTGGNTPISSCASGSGGRRTGGPGISVGSTATLATGELVLDYTLPSYRSLGVDHALSLVYSSGTANPWVLEPFDVSIVADAAPPPFISFETTFGGVGGIDHAVLAKAEGFLNAGQRGRFTAVLDVGELETGLHSRVLKVTSVYPPAALVSPLASAYLCDSDRVEQRGVTAVDLRPHVNAAASPYGAGWGVRGVSRLHAGGAQMLLVDGNGDRIIYRPLTGGPGQGEDLFIVGGGGSALAEVNGPFLNDGTGGFSPAGNWCAVGDHPMVSDFDDDGVLDVAVRNQLGSDFSLVIYFGSVSTSAPFSVSDSLEIPNCNRGYTIGKFDGDDLDDIVCLHAPGPLSGPQSTVRLLLNQNNTVPRSFVETYSDVVTPHSVFFEPANLVIARDFTGDGNLDVAIFLYKLPGEIVVLAGNGAGDLQLINDGQLTVTSEQLSIYERSQVAAFDIDADGDEDFIVPRHPSSGPVHTLFLNNGAGQFLQREDLLSIPLEEATGFARGDLDEDGAPEIVVGYKKCPGVDVDCLVVYKGAGLLWVVETEIPIGPVGMSVQPKWILIGDVTGDGHPDLVVSQNGQWEVAFNVVAGHGDLTFEPWVGHPNELNYDLCSPSLQEHFGMVLGKFGEDSAAPAAPALASYKTLVDDSMLSWLGDHWERVYGDGNSERFDAAGFLFESEDRNGNVTVFEYTDFDALQRIIDPVGLETRFEYDPSHKLTRIIDPANRATAFTVDSLGRLESIRDAEMNETRYLYQHALPNLVTSQLPPRSQVESGDFDIQYLYDPNYGRLIGSSKPTATPAVRDTISVEPTILQATIPPPSGDCNTAGGLSDAVGGATATVSTSEWGAVVARYSMGLDGRPTRDQVVVYDGGPTAKTYSWNIQSDASSRARRTTRDDGSYIERDYDTHGNLRRTYDSATDAEVRYGFDPSLTRLARVYDAECNAAAASCPGPLVTLGYDIGGRGNLETITMRTSDETRIGYDEKGRPTLIMDATLAETELIYDDGGGNGNLVEIRRNGPGGPLVTKFGYDGAGNLLWTEDPEGNVSSSEYDLVGRATLIRDANDQETLLEYDRNGNLTKVTDPLGQETTFIYDVRDRLVERTVTDAVAGGEVSETYTYTPSDRVATYTDRKGQVTTNSYDSLGRLLGRELQQSPLGPVVGSYGFTYDDRSRLLSAFGPMLASELAYSYAYDPGAAVRTVKTTIGGSLFGPDIELTATADRNGFRTGLTVDGLADVPDIGYVPDTLGRLATILRDTTEAATFGYDALGRRDRMEHRDGLSVLGSVDYIYDDLGRLTDIDNRWGATVVSHFEYPSAGYDGVGNFTSRNQTRGAAPAETDTFSYDDLYRVATASLDSGPIEGFCYDEVGNREPAPSCAPAWTYEEPNRLVDDGAASYDSDLNGNLETKTTTGGAFTFEWDVENRLTKIMSGATTLATANYDAFGRRVEKTWMDGATTRGRRYIYDGDAILAELDETGAVGASYLQGPGIDEPLAMTRAGAEYRYFGDILGSITELVNAGTGTVANRYHYGVFGQTTVEPAVGAVENPIAFTGREWERNWPTGGDESESLYYYRARYYDPAVGRFVSEDPIGFAGGDWNLYGYVRNNPLLFRDPSGHCPPLLILTVVAAPEISAGAAATYTAITVVAGTAWWHLTKPGDDSGNPAFPPPWIPTVEQPSFPMPKPDMKPDCQGTLSLCKAQAYRAGTGTWPCYVVFAACVADKIKNWF